MKNIYLAIPAEVSSNEPLALATVIDTRGSTPQKQGNSALFGPAGLISGTIGGGILEGRVQQIAKSVALTGKSGIYHFDLDKDISFKQEAICGGRAVILIDASPHNSFTAIKGMKESLGKRIPGVLVTVVSGVEETDKKIARYWVEKGKKIDLPDTIPEQVWSEIQDLLSGSTGSCFRQSGGIIKSTDFRSVVFLEAIFPQSRLVIAGAGHIGKALAHLGKMLDFEVMVIDDRIEYANRENIPDADHIIVKDIGDAMSDISKTADNYFVIITRGHNDDAKALKTCINSGAAYVGMIGSKTKIEKMRTDFLLNHWVTEEQWSSVYAPIGIDILSKTVEEIAVSIAAQLIQVRNGKK